MANEFNIICKPDRGGQFLDGNEGMTVPSEYRVRDESGEVMYMTEDFAVAYAMDLQGRTNHATYIVRGHSEQAEQPKGRV